jgi:hypothetical protein
MPRISKEKDKEYYKKWVSNNKDKVKKIKDRYVENHPDRRKDSWTKYNNEHKEKKAKSNSRWYDSHYFSGRRKLLLEVQPFCARCGSNKRLFVHHRDGQGTTSEFQNNEWENLIVLCPSCHTTVHMNKEKPYYVG